MSALDHDARSLFATARADGPDDDERDAVFQKVVLATGLASVASVATGVAKAPGATASASAFSGKLLAIGGVIGAVGTALGVFITLALVKPAAPNAKGPTTEDRAASGVVGEARAGFTAREVASGATLDKTGVRGRDAEDTHANAPGVAESPTVAPSDLAEEARLVTAARAPLVAGDAARALSLVRATHKLGARSLEPEELGLEARALRALDRADEAATTEFILRRRYPDSALAR